MPYSTPSRHCWQITEPVRTAPCLLNQPQHRSFLCIIHSDGVEREGGRQRDRGGGRGESRFPLIRALSSSSSSSLPFLLLSLSVCLSPLNFNATAAAAVHASLPLSLPISRSPSVILEIIHQVHSRQHGSQSSLSLPPSHTGSGKRRGMERRENRSGAERERRGGGRTDGWTDDLTPLLSPPSSPPHPHVRVRPSSGAVALFSCRVCFSWRVTDYRRREREPLLRVLPQLICYMPSIAPTGGSKSGASRLSLMLLKSLLVAEIRNVDHRSVGQWDI